MEDNNQTSPVNWTVMRVMREGQVRHNFVDTIDAIDSQWITKGTHLR